MSVRLNSEGTATIYAKFMDKLGNVLGWLKLYPAQKADDLNLDVAQQFFKHRPKTIVHRDVFLFINGF